MSFLFHAARCALLLLVPMLVPGAALAQGVTITQGVTPYDTYQDARGGPLYSGNLTTLPDDRDLLGPGLALSDPFLERVRPARGYGEIEDVGAGYFEWQADRLRQIGQSTQELDDQRRMCDEQYRLDSERLNSDRLDSESMTLRHGRR
jgi:hypothetical protein